MLGILKFLSSILANAGISIFAISTYDTDYILVNKSKAKEALDAFIKNGVVVRNAEIRAGRDLVDES